MDVSWTPKALSTDRGVIRCGRPRRELAGEVEQRILDAAGKVFLERGFEGASVEEIAEVARAGKPTIYARFPSKEALFAAVVARKVRANTSIQSVAAMGSTIEQRLEAIASIILGRILFAREHRVDASSGRGGAPLPRSGDQRQTAGSRSRDRVGGAPFGRSRPVRPNGRLAGLRAGSLSDTARRFMDVIVFPMAMRALFGEDLSRLRAEIGPHVRHAVAFFLAACRHAPPDSHGPDQLAVRERADAEG
jgi:AcrR family transcriptional regulator